MISERLLSARDELYRQFARFEAQVRTLARQDRRAHILMSTPGVGVIVALTYVAAIDDPSRFRSSRMVGAHFGLIPTCIDDHSWAQSRRLMDMTRQG